MKPPSMQSKNAFAQVNACLSVARLLNPLDDRCGQYLTEALKQCKENIDKQCDTQKWLDVSILVCDAYISRDKALPKNHEMKEAVGKIKALSQQCMKVFCAIKASPPKDFFVAYYEDAIKGIISYLDSGDEKRSEISYIKFLALKSRILAGFENARTTLKLKEYTQIPAIPPGQSRSPEDGCSLNMENSRKVLENFPSDSKDPALIDTIVFPVVEIFYRVISICNGRTAMHVGLPEKTFLFKSEILGIGQDICALFPENPGIHRLKGSLVYQTAFNYLTFKKCNDAILFPTLGNILTLRFSDPVAKLDEIVFISKMHGLFTQKFDDFAKSRRNELLIIVYKFCKKLFTNFEGLPEETFTSPEIYGNTYRVFVKNIITMAAFILGKNYPGEFSLLKDLAKLIAGSTVKPNESKQESCLPILVVLAEFYRDEVVRRKIDKEMLQHLTAIRQAFTPQNPASHKLLQSTLAELKMFEAAVALSIRQKEIKAEPPAVPPVQEARASGVTLSTGEVRALLDQSSKFKHADAKHGECLAKALKICQENIEKQTVLQQSCDWLETSFQVCNAYISRDRALPPEHEAKQHLTEIIGLSQHCIKVLLLIMDQITASLLEHYEGQKRNILLYFQEVYQVGCEESDEDSDEDDDEENDEEVDEKKGVMAPTPSRPAEFPYKEFVALKSKILDGIERAQSRLELPEIKNIPAVIQTKPTIQLKDRATLTQEEYCSISGENAREKMLANFPEDSKDASLIGSCIFPVAEFFLRVISICNTRPEMHKDSPEDVFQFKAEMLDIGLLICALYDKHPSIFKLKIHFLYQTAMNYLNFKKPNNVMLFHTLENLLPLQCSDQISMRDEINSIYAVCVLCIDQFNKFEGPRKNQILAMVYTLSRKLFTNFEGLPVTFFSNRELYLNHYVEFFKQIIPIAEFIFNQNYQEEFSLLNGLARLIKQFEYQPVIISQDRFYLPVLAAVTHFYKNVDRQKIDKGMLNHLKAIRIAFTPKKPEERSLLLSLIALQQFEAPAAAPPSAPTPPAKKSKATPSKPKSSAPEVPESLPQPAAKPQKQASAPAVTLSQPQPSAPKTPESLPQPVSKQKKQAKKLKVPAVILSQPEPSAPEAPASLSQPVAKQQRQARKLKAPAVTLSQPKPSELEVPERLPQPDVKQLKSLKKQQASLNRRLTQEKQEAVRKYGNLEDSLRDKTRECDELTTRLEGVEEQLRKSEWHKSSADRRVEDLVKESKQKEQDLAGFQSTLQQRDTALQEAKTTIDKLRQTDTQLRSQLADAPAKARRVEELTQESAQNRAGLTEAQAKLRQRDKELAEAKATIERLTKADKQLQSQLAGAKQSSTTQALQIEQLTRISVGDRTNSATAQAKLQQSDQQLQAATVTIHQLMGQLAAATRMDADKNRQIMGLSGGLAQAHAALRQRDEELQKSKQECTDLSKQNEDLRRDLAAKKKEFEVQSELQLATKTKQFAAFHREIADLRKQAGLPAEKVVDPQEGFRTWKPPVDSSTARPAGDPRFPFATPSSSASSGANGKLPDSPAYS